MKKKLSLIAKMIIIGLVMEAITICLVSVSMATTAEQFEGFETMYTKHLLRTRYIGNMQVIMQQAASDLQYTNMYRDDKEKLSMYRQNFIDTCDKFEPEAKQFLSTLTIQEDRDAIEKLIDSQKLYKELGAEVARLHLVGETPKANELAETKFKSIRTEEIAPVLLEFLDSTAKKAAGEYEHLSYTAAASKRFLFYIIAFGVILSIVLFYLVIRSISRPIRHIVNTLTDSNEQLTDSSNQLSESSQMIATGSQEQAASIEETSASMEELSSMVKQNLVNVRQASILSDKAMEASSSGNSKMETMLLAMENISHSTEDIKNVIDIIDDIAFQTNMLALNAAVEAARAGEAGMGFAVVADEVKNLANRSQSSAKETATMIKETIKNVEQGMNISNEMEQIFSDILLNSKKVTEMNREVESASTQQEEGIDQINKALIQLDSVVQANASSAEETANAAEELHSQVSSSEEVIKNLYSVVYGTIISYGNKKADSNKKKKPNPPEEKPMPQAKKQIEQKSKSTAIRPLKPQEEKHTIPFEDDEDFTETF